MYCTVHTCVCECTRINVYIFCFPIQIFFLQVATANATAILGIWSLLSSLKNRFTYTYGFNWTEYFDNIIVYKWNNSYLKERAPVSAKSMQKPQQGKHLQWRVLNCNWGRQSRCKELLKRRHTHREISIWKCQTQHPFTWSMSWINTLLATFL